MKNEKNSVRNPDLDAIDKALIEKFGTRNMQRQEKEQNSSSNSPVQLNNEDLICI